MKRNKILKFKSEVGSATIEAIISFTGFLFVIFTILGVVNVCRVQMLISNAVDTVAKELTQYSYFYEMSGLSKFKDEVNKQAEIGANNLNDVIGTVDTFASTVGNAYDKSEQHKTNIENAVTDFNVEDLQKEILGVGTDIELIDGSIKSMEASFGSVADNPLMYMKSIVAVAGSEFIDTSVSHVIAAPLSKALFTKHFGKNATEANKELEKLGVVGGLDGMNFKMSTLFAKESPKDVHLVVYYKLKLVQLLDWANLEVPMCKESIGHAWLGGDSVINKVKPMDKPVIEETPEGETPKEETAEDSTESEEATESEETTEKDDFTNSYWHMSQEELNIAYANGQLPAGFKMDALGMYYLSGVVVSNQTTFIAQAAGDAEMKRDKPKDFAQSYTITKSNDKTDSTLSVYALGALNRIGASLESQDGETKVDRTYTLEIFVPENISDEEYEKLEKEIKDAEFLVKLNVDSAKKGEPNQFYQTLATNTEYEFKIVKTGGNYDYGSEGK